MMLHPGISRTLGLLAASALASVLAAVANGFRHVARIRRNHRDIACLQGLDDRALRDIGLVRSDLHGAASVPFWRDPGPVLIRNADFRETGRQASIGAPSIVPVIAEEVQPSEVSVRSAR